MDTVLVKALIKGGGLDDPDARALAVEVQRRRSENEEMRQALSWALDSLDLCFRRIDTIDDLSEEHHAIRAAGMAKARSALASKEPEA